jgi:hypothetical protein
LPIGTDLSRGSRLEATSLIVGVAEATGAAGAPAPAAGSLTLHRRGEQEPLGAFPVSLEPDSPGGSPQLLASIPLRDLKAGAYALVLEMRRGEGVAAHRAVGCRIR